MISRSGDDDVPRVGSLLRASRLRRGEEAADIAQTLHIRLVYITAIEDGRYDDLPGATYAIGFIRAYAKHLGLDREEVVRRFKAETSGLDVSANLKFLSPIPENGIPRGAILFIGMVIAVLAYGGWYVNSTQDHFLTDLIPSLPERLAVLLPTDGATDFKAPPSGPDAVLAGEAPQGDSVGDSAADSVAETAPSIAVTPIAEVAVTIAPPPIKETPVVEASPVVAPEPKRVTQTVAAITEPLPVAERGEEPTPSSPDPDASPLIAATTDAPAQAVSTPPPPADAEPVADRRQPTPPTAPETAATPSPPVEVKSLGLVEDSVAIPEVPRPEAAGGDGDMVAALTENTERKRANDTAPPAEERGSRIVVRARMASWIQIRDDAGNQLLMTRLMRAGDTFRVPDRPGLTLLTGNAGALEILVDGATMPPLGPIGAVRRDVTLDIEMLRKGTAAVE